MIVHGSPSGDRLLCGCVARHHGGRVTTMAVASVSHISFTYGS